LARAIYVIYCGDIYIYSYDIHVSRRSNQCKNSNIFNISILSYISAALLEVMIFIIDAERISYT